MTAPQLDIREVFEHIGGEVRSSQTSGYVKVRCPFHDDRNPSASINVDKGYFRCFVCGESLDGYGLLMRHYDIGFREAADIARRADIGSESEGGDGGGGGLLRKADNSSGGSVPPRQGHRPNGGSWRPAWLR